MDILQPPPPAMFMNGPLWPHEYTNKIRYLCINFDQKLPFKFSWGVESIKAVWKRFLDQWFLNFTAKV